MPPTGIEHLVDVAFGVAMGWLLSTRRSFRFTPATRLRPTRMDIATVETAGADSAASSVPTTPHGESSEQIATHTISREEAGGWRSLQEKVPQDAGSSADSEGPPSHIRPRRTAGALRLAPPPTPESETPAHRVMRLGDAPESPIHSESPDDWEDLPMPSGEVWLAPRGLRALGDRADAAFHLRQAFRRVK